MSDVPKEPIAEMMDIRLHLAMLSIQNAMTTVQDHYQMDSFRMAAVMGQALGDIFACADATFEKREAATIREEQKEPYKQTLLLNLSDAYNRHRALHERKECAPKPEPKIV